MHRYQFPAPRLTIAFAAVAMTALTIGVLVELPSRMESESQTYAMIAASANTVMRCLTGPPESAGPAQLPLDAELVVRSPGGTRQGS